MSEPTATPSLESVISSSIADLPGSDASTGETGDHDVVDVADMSTSAPSIDTSAVTPDPTIPALDEFDTLIDGEMGAGHTKKQDNRIPHSRTRKIVEKAKKDWAALQETANKGQTDKLSSYEARLQNIDQVERIMESNPEQFMQMLGQMNPAYQRYAGGQGQQPPPEPQQFNTAQDLENYVNMRLDQRLAPFEQEQASRAIYAAAAPKVQAQLEAAGKRPLFKENEGAILKVLQDNPSMGLMDAYDTVVLPKLSASRDTMRQELMAELKNVPHTTSTMGSSGLQREETGPRDLSDVIKAAIRGK